MRKLFVLLLIALVPLSIGCRLTENDDAGPDVTLAPQNPPANLTLTANVPAANLANGSIRQAVTPFDIQVFIDNVQLTTDGVLQGTAPNQYYKFTKTLSKAEISGSTADELKKIINNNGIGNATLKIVVKGVVQTTTIAINASAATATESKTVEIKIDLNPNPNGTFSMTVTVTNGGTGSATLNNATPTFQILDIQYKNPGGQFASLSGATGVATSGLTIRVIFNSATISNATNTFTITAKSSVTGATDVTLTEADLAGTSPLATAQIGTVTINNNTYACVDVTLNRTTTGTPARVFAPNKTYTLSMTQNADQTTFSVQSGTNKLPAGYTTSRTFTTAAQ